VNTQPSSDSVEAAIERLWRPDVMTGSTACPTELAAELVGLLIATRRPAAYEGLAREILRWLP
jgi:hypothetical protein